MDANLRDQIAQLYARLCAALSDPTRITMVYLLAEVPFNVSELAAALDLPQPTVSRHLKVLRERRLVIAERRGKAVYYTLADTRVIEALDLLRSVMHDILSDQAALVVDIEEELAHLTPQL